MPVFNIALEDGRKLQIDADSQEAALAGVQHFNEHGVQKPLGEKLANFASKVYNDPPESAKILTAPRDAYQRGLAGLSDEGFEKNVEEARGLAGFGAGLARIPNTAGMLRPSAPKLKPEAEALLQSAENTASTVSAQAPPAAPNVVQPPPGTLSSVLNHPAADFAEMLPGVGGMIGKARAAARIAERMRGAGEPPAAAPAAPAPQQPFTGQAAPAAPGAPWGARPPSPTVPNVTQAPRPTAPNPLDLVSQLNGDPYMRPMPPPVPPMSDLVSRLNATDQTGMGLAQPPKGFAQDLVAETRAVNKITKGRDGQVTMEAMPLIKQLAQQNKREPYNTPSVQDIGKPWDTPSVSDIGKPWATPQVGPGQPVPLGLPKPAWQQPNVNAVPPGPPMQMPAPAPQLALPPPRPGPASPFPGAPQGAPMQMGAPPGAPLAPPPALVAQAMAKANGAQRPATIMPAPKRALEAPTPAAADDLAIPAFLRRDASNAVPTAPVAPVAPVPSIQATKVLARMSAAEKIATAHNAKVNGSAPKVDLPTAPEGSPHYSPGDLKSTVASARNDFLSSKGIDPEGPLPNWMSQSLGTIERVITDKVKTGEKLAKDVPGFDVHDFTSRYVHTRTFAGGEQLKARMKAQYPGHADAFDTHMSEKAFSTIYKNKTSAKDGTRKAR